VTVMAVNTQFSIAVHLLAALAYRRHQDTTSGELARSVNTSPSFVRGRWPGCPGGLVETATGKAGACWLANDRSRFPCWMFTKAVDAPKVFANPCLCRAKNPARYSCHIKSALEKALEKTQHATETGLDGISLAEIVLALKN